MKQTKQYYYIVILIIIAIMTMVGCAKNEGEAPSVSGENNKIRIVTTIFPLYDFANQIGGEQVKVTSIIPSGSEPHDFEPSAKDMMEINKADIFIYSGAGYEKWVERAIQNLDTDKTKVIDASIGTTLLSTLEDEEHAHNDGEGTEEHDEHEHGEYDPHIWLDPMNAKVQANGILAALIELAPEHQAYFQANYDQFAAELDALDQQYKEALEQVTKHEVVVSHQAFGYLASRYDFEQIPVAGISPSSEPTQQELLQLIELVKEHQLKYVAFDSLVESKVAKTVQREANVEAVTLYTIENITKEQHAKGITYLDLMRENLETLKKVLEVR